jgi:hypothetical protein
MGLFEEAAYHTRGQASRLYHVTLGLQKEASNILWFRTFRRAWALACACSFIIKLPRRPIPLRGVSVDRAWLNQLLWNQRGSTARPSPRGPHV